MSIAIQTSLHGSKIGLTKDNDIVVQNPVTGAQEIVVPAPGGKVVPVTAATLAATKDLHGGRTTTLSRAAGQAVTLPASVGKGLKLRFVLGATVTSNTTTFKVAAAADTFQGNSMVVSDDPATVKGFIAAAGTDDTVTLNGTTTGGYIGDIVEFEDIAVGIWQVAVRGKATGTEATPFSNTVS